MLPEVLLAGVILLALLVYALSGGADFGGGVWDLFARGERATRQRRLIIDAIAPIWEANHVWLIVAVVVLFVGFPKAFAAIGTALHIPLALMLVGIVLRGSAFVFRTNDPHGDGVGGRWSTVFSVASTVTPVMLGVTLGAVAGGGLLVDPVTGAVDTDFISAWWAPFPWAVGLFALCLFAFLAAVYLTVEAQEDDLREDFRRRALAAALAVGVAAWLSFAAAAIDAPEIFAGLAESTWALPFQIVTGATALAAIAALVKRRFYLARLLAITQVTLIVLGWGMAQFPYLIPPSLDVTSGAALPVVLWTMLVALAAGSLIIAPAFFMLYRVFKGHPT